MKFTLKIWRQNTQEEKGAFQTYKVEDISPDVSFLEMLDILNNSLEGNQEEPIVFDHDCREGICGMCSLFINGQAHGPQKATTTCQLHMRSFQDGDSIYIEPWRAKAFPVVKDLMVDRSAFDKILHKGGYISVRAGSAPDAHTIPVQKECSDIAMDAAECIGCGACVAACKNASASLFVAAKVSHLAHLPQGRVEEKRVLSMVDKMDELGFGHCSNDGECEAACPKEISIKHISVMNRSFLKKNIK